MSAVRGARSLKSQSAPPRLPLVIQSESSRTQVDGGRIVGHLQKAVQDYHQEKEQLVDGINALQRNFEGLSNILGREKEEHESMKKLCQDLKAQLHDARSQLKLNNVVRVELERLQEEYAMYRDAMEQQVVFQLGQFEELVQQIGRVQGELFLEEAKTIAALAEAEQRELQQRMGWEAAEAARLALVAELELSHKAARHAEARCNALSSELAATKAAVQDQQEELERQAALSAAAVSGEKEKLLAELKRLTAASVADQQTITQLRSDSAQQAAALQKLIESWHNQRQFEFVHSEDELRNVLQQSEDDMRTTMASFQKLSAHWIAEWEAQSAIAQSTMSKAEMRANELQQMLALQEAQAKQRIQQLEEQCHNTACQLDQLRDAAQRERQVREQLAQDAIARQQHEMSAQGMADHLKTANAELKRRVTELAADVMQLQAEVAASTAAHEKSAAALAQMTSEMDQWKSTATRLQEEVDVHRTANEKLQDVLSKKEADILSLEKEMADMHQQLTAALKEQNNSAALLQDLTALQHEKDALLAEIKAHISDNKQLRLQCDDLRQVVLSEEASNRQLQSALKAVTAAAEEARASNQKLQAELHALQQVKLHEAELEEQKLKSLRERAVACLAKLTKAEEASESAYTCLSCLRIYERPTICVPCGHTFCERCIDHKRDDRRDMMYCKECADHTVTDCFLIQGLDLLCGKFVYRRQVLTDLLNEFAPK